MNRTKELKRLVNETFPASGYSLKERMYYRKNLYNDILSYQDSHPDCTIEEIKCLFCEKNEIAAPSMDSVHLLKKTKIVVFCVLLVLLVCFLMLKYSATWKPPVIEY